MLASGRLGVGLLVLFMTHVMAQGAMAYPRMIFEREPNDTLEQAQSLRGEAQLVGEVSGNDQDLFRWSLDEAEADQHWRLELYSEGEVQFELGHVDGALVGTDSAAPSSGVTTFGGGVASFGETEDIDVAPAQNDAGSDQPSEWLTLTTSSRTSRHASELLLIPAGEYLLRFKSEGGEGGHYRLMLTAEDRTSIHGTVDADESVDITVRPGRQWYFQLNTPKAVIPLAIDSEPQQLWRLELVGELGASVEAWVEDSDGEVIAEASAESPLQQRWGQLAIAEGSRLHLRHRQGDAIGRIGVAATEDGWQVGRAAAATSAVEPDMTVVPGNRPEQRVWVAPEDPQTFHIAQNQQRYLAFHVAENEAPLRLAVAAEGEAVWQLCLSVLGTRDEICRKGPHEALFSAMQLEPGDYGVRIRREGRDNTDSLAMTLSLYADAPRAEGWINRPADSAAWAFPLLPDETAASHSA